MAEVDKFGHGILFPFVRDEKGDFANAGELDCLSSDISMLLGVIGPSVDGPGELPFATELGSRIVELKHRQIHSDLTNALASQYTGETIRRWDNRVRVGKTTTQILDQGGQENMLLVKTVVKPVGYNSNENTIVSAEVELEE